MKTFMRHALACLLLIFVQQALFAQPVDLGVASGFAVFSAAGAFSNDGTTVVTGDIGTNVGAFAGFPPGIVIGSIHVADVITAQAATDVGLAYGQLSAMNCDSVLGTTLGNGQILPPNIYCLGAASVLNGDLILDGGCDPDAIFIFQIDGALATTVLSNVILQNSASLCNVYWQVNGAVTLGPSSVFRGNIVAGGAIHLLDGASLFGRALTTAGAIDMHTNVVDRDMLPVGSILTAAGPTTFCEGESVTLNGNCGGTWNNGATTTSITVSASGNYFVTTTNGCGSAVSNVIIVTANPLPVCTITGNLSICAGQSTVLCTTAGLASYLWNTGATINCITVNAAGTYTVTVTNANGCSSVCSQTVAVGTPPVCTITGNLSICAGQSTVLCTTAGLASYLWNTGVTINCITVNAAGTYTVTVTDANGCSSVCSQTVAVGTPPVCTITGNLSICAGQSTVLCTTTGLASYLWNTGATINCITVNAAGTYTVTVTDANGCSSVCSQTVAVGTPPVCTITGNLSICAGQSTVLCTTAGLASYLWNTGATINCITVNAAGTYTVTVTDANGCSSVCSQTVAVGTPPVCTITGNLSICAGQSTVLCTTAGLASYVWNTGATINCITVNAAGTYTVTVTDANGCSSVCSQTVAVGTPPVCTITGNLSICAGQSTVLCTTAGLASYVWNTGATINCITVNAAGTYTVTVTDANGCSSVCSQTVTVSLGNTPPVITCPSNVLLTCNANTSPANTGFAIASDNCGSTLPVTFNDGIQTNGCAQDFTIIRTWSATDANGNSMSCSQAINVQDNTPPSINCPVVISPIQCGSAPNFGAPTATDACDATVTVTFSDITVAGSCPQAYSVTRTWTAADDCGNTSQCSRTIVVQDNTPPSINCPVVISPIQCGSAPNFGAPTATDACDATVTVSFSDITVAGSCPQAYSVTRTWTAADDCGNTSQCSRTIVVQDNTPPSINCPVVISPIQCGSAPNFGAPTATDACDATVTVTFSDITVAGSCPQAYSVTRTWTAADDCGNTSQCSRTIIVQDNTPPSINCPVVISPIQCGSAPNFGAPTATDACDATVTVTFSDITVAGSCPQAYSVTRTWTAADDCGNTSQCSRTIVVQDNTPPIINCPVVISPIQCGSAPNFGAPTATDACDATVTVTFSDITVAGSCPQAYSVTRTWTAADDCGNTSQCSRTIVVQDNTPPSINCPVVISPIQCGSAPNFGAPTATDACDATVTVTFSDITVAGSCLQAYSVTRTWTAADDCGNTSQCSRTIVVQDNTSPSINCPAVISPIQCGSAPNFGAPTATDACDATVTVTFSDITVAGSCPQAYSVTRTWTAADDCGNTSQCSRTIVVQDNEPPLITLPQGLTNGDTLRVQCYGQDPTWDLPLFNANSIIAVDACGGNIVVAFNQHLVNEGNCGVDGYINLYRLQWTATDACGNSSSAFAYMTLVDTIAPAIFGVPADTTVNCDQIPLLPTLVYATDECLCACVILFEETISSPGSGCQDGKIIVRTWTATDRCGNETIARQNITLIDTTGPVIQIMQPQIDSVLNGTVLQYKCSEGGIPAFFDGLSAESVTSSPACGEVGSYSFESHTIVSRNCEFFGYVEQRSFQWTAIDKCGNTTHFTILAQLIDDEAPSIIGLPTMACVGDPALNDVEAIDDCGNAHLRFWETQVSNPCGTGMAIRRTYEAYDDCGNITLDTVILLPNDLSLPVIDFVNSNLSLLLDDGVLNVPCHANGAQLTSYGAGDVFTNDRCGVTISFEEKFLSNGDCKEDGYVALISLIWTATDVCGNHSEEQMLAKVVDHTSPVFVNFKPVVSIGCHDAMPEIFTSDNCGGVVMMTIDSIIPGKCEFQYDVLRMITISDPCGNSSTLAQLVHVGDGGGPTIEGVIENVCDDSTIPIVTAYDACAQEYVEVTMVQDTLEFYCTDGLVIQRIWSATDACGNTRVVTQTIILHDVTPPDIQVPSYSVINFFVNSDSNQVLLSQSDLLKKLNDLNENSVYMLDDCDLHIEVLFTVDTSFAEDCIAAGYAERRTYTWIAMDICGNTDTLTFVVYIIDDLPPVMNKIPADTIYVCQPLPPVPNMLSEVAGQAASVTYTQLIEPGDSPGELNVTRTWIAFDSCHNSNTVVQHILWIPSSLIQCNILLPDSVDCNSHGVLIESQVSEGFGPYTYVWQIVGEKCFIQAGQGTPDIQIYIGWSEVKIILTVTDAYGCVSMCMATLSCFESFESFAFSPSNLNVKTKDDGSFPSFHTIWNQEPTEQIQKLTYWPNPASETMNLGFESSIHQEVNIKMVNLLNQVVLRDQFRALPGYNTYPMWVAHLPNGSYVMEVKNGTEIHTQVIVIFRNE